MPGTLERMTINNLKPNQEYYIYIKSKKVTDGVTHISESSDFIFFKTAGSIDSSKSYRIDLYPSNIYDQVLNIGYDSNNNDVNAVNNLIDEQGKNIYDSNGNLDLKNKGTYTTEWGTYKYDRTKWPYDIVFDLSAECKLDKLFICGKSGKGNFSVYALKDVGYEYEKIGSYDVYFNSWITVDFKNTVYRFFKISFENMYTDAVGVEAFPLGTSFNGSIVNISNMILYGTKTVDKPLNLKPVKRKSTVRKTVDQFFCTNGHAYQNGRIHSMCSGKNVRLYIHYGHFAAKNNQNILLSKTFTNMSDVVFRLNNIPWITGNNGTGVKFEEHLKNTYKKYGLLPYLTSTGTFDYCKYSGSSYSREVDDYWLPNKWTPLPTRSINGLVNYYNITKNPLNYKTVSKLCYALAAKFGSNILPEDLVKVYIDETFNTYENKTSGLNLIGGIEPGNELDASWHGWEGYTSSEEEAAMMNALYDGSNNRFSNVEANNVYGTKNADSSMLMISPGTASQSPTRYFTQYMHYKKNRLDGSIPVDVFAFHLYCSNSGLSQENSKSEVQYAITFEDAMNSIAGDNIKKLIDIRDRYMPAKEIWVNEFGYGESGGINTASKYQCYSQAGRIINGWTIPDRHRSDVKGAWIIRAAIQMMSLGIDQLNYYATEAEADFWNTGVYGQGAGMGMFHWNDVTDNTPGAKIANISQYETTAGRGGFATTGLFGPLLSCGGYPITRSYWYVATFRNRLKDYVFTGFKYKDDIDSKIIIACFKHISEEKGAYVVYYNDSVNTGATNIEIELPLGTTVVKKVETYVPEIPNPESIPDSLKYESAKRARTALPGSVHTIIDGIETVTLPTAEENPYFPIIGPVGMKINKISQYINANQYIEETLDENGSTIISVKYDLGLAWKQVDNICDFIEFHPEGIKGANGIETNVDIIRGGFVANISEFPDYYFFDAIPDPDYKSHVEDLSANTISSSSIKLFWNNINTEDTGYQIFKSSLPETGYELVTEILADIENSFIVQSLSPNTTYYFKIRPVNGVKIGSLSDYVPAKTTANVDTPTNLSISKKSINSIVLSWNYDDSTTTSFLYYAIYRSTEVSGYSLVGEVTDKTIKGYTDTNLISGTYYKYKVKVVCTDGISEYSNEVYDRTLLPEENPPTLLSAFTDKLGTKLILTFDISLKILPDYSILLTLLSLTEDSNSRLIQSAYVDPNNQNRLILNIGVESLADYDKLTDIRIGFISDNRALLSIYDVPVQSFNNKVSNVIGNYSNINAVYNINFASTAETDIPSDTEWNNLIGSPETDLANKESDKIHDTYGRDSAITITPIINTSISPKSKWSGTTTGYNRCAIEGIPVEVSQSRWYTYWDGADITEKIISRLLLKNLNKAYKYDIKVFGSMFYPGDVNRPLKMKANGIYSNTINTDDNASSIMLLESVVPTSDGQLSLDFINGQAEGVKQNQPINFMILTEYNPNDIPSNYEPFIKSLSILEDSENSGVVSTTSINIHVNSLGTALQYRVSSSPDFSGALWKEFDNSIGNIPFTIAELDKLTTIYVQLNNSIGASNIRSIAITAHTVSPSVTLENIIINNGDVDSVSTVVNVFFNISGSQPTHYMLSELSDFSDATWTEYLSATAQFTLSSELGEKIIYAKVKNDYNESAIVSDSITLYAPLSLNGVVINNGAVETTSKIVDISILAVGTPTHYMLSENADFSNGVWVAFVNPISFVLSDTYATKTVYAKVKDSHGESSSVSDSINYVAQSEIGRKVLLANVATSGNVAGVGYVNIGAKPYNGATVLRTIYDTNGIKMFSEIDQSTSKGGTTLTNALSLWGITSLRDIPHSYFTIPTLTTTGDYPNSMITDAAKNIVMWDTVSTLNPETAQAAHLFTGVPNGTYKVRVLLSSGVATTYKPSLVRINNTTQAQPADMNLLNNNTQWFTFENIIITDGNMLVANYQQRPTPGTRVYWSEPMVIIEITRTA